MRACECFKLHFIALVYIALAQFIKRHRGFFKSSKAVLEARALMSSVNSKIPPTSASRTSSTPTIAPTLELLAVLQHFSHVATMGPPPGAPTQLQPRPKALATANISAAVSSTSNRTPISPSIPRSSRLLFGDPLSDRATEAFIRRILYPQAVLAEKGRTTPLPVEAVLPPLTSSNDVDLQLYAFIAIIIKEFVYPWYATITPDQTFVEEVVRIIAHCTRALEQRLRKVDLESLVFDEIPDLVDAHVTGQLPGADLSFLSGRRTLSCPERDETRS